MKKTILYALFCLVCTPLLAQAANSKYQALPTDKNFQSLLSRWAALDGKTLEWKSKVSFGLSNSENLNTDLKLSKNSTLNEAIAKTLDILKVAYAEYPFKSCPVKSKIIITSVNDNCDFYKDGKLYYVAEHTDKTVSQLVERWAAREGVRVSWEAKIDYPIDEHHSFNYNSTLPNSTELNFAVHKVLKFINLKYPMDINIKECIKPEGIIIRPVFASCNT